MNEHHRRPAAFRLDDPNVVVTAEGWGAVACGAENDPRLTCHEGSVMLSSVPPMQYPTGLTVAEPAIFLTTSRAASGPSSR